MYVVLKINVRGLCLLNQVKEMVVETNSYYLK